MYEIRFYKSPLKYLKRFALAAIILFLLLRAILKEEAEIPNMIWVFVLILVAAFFKISFHILDRRTQIIINKIGIWDRSTNEEVIKWEWIEKASSIKIYNQNFIPLETNKNFIPKKKLYKWAANLNTNIGAQKINLQLTSIKTDIEKLVIFINCMKEANDKERDELIKSFKDKFK